MSTTTPVKLLDKTALRAKIPYSFSTIWSKIRTGEFPPPRRFGQKALWIESEIDQFIATLPTKKYKPAKPGGAR